MNKINFKTLVLSLLAVAFMQSCISSDDNSIVLLTKDEAKDVMTRMYGEYSGQLGYKDCTTKKDSLINDISAISAGDSILKVYDIPSYVVSNFLSSIPELQANVKSKPSQTMMIYMNPYTFQKSKDMDLYQFYYSVSEFRYDDIVYNGSKHNLKVRFLRPLLGQWGKTQAGKTAFLLTFYFAGIYEGDSETPVVQGFDPSHGYATNNPQSTFQIMISKSALTSD